MSNSGLVSYTKLSPNNSGTRTHTIDTVSIHCVVGQLSVETLGSIFAQSSKQASSNYGIGSDGRVGMYVPESKRSWCTSNAANDQRAVTIECASDTTSPYAVKTVVYNKLIILLTDICRRNGIKKLVWSTTKSARVNHSNGCNMTVHRDYASKACPGDYLYNRHGSIASAVNANLNNSVIYYGFVGDDVKDMQILLIAAGYGVGDDGADGVYGGDTYTALTAFQTANGLTADGVCGAATWAALKGAEPEPETKTVKLTNADVFSAPPVQTGVTGTFTIVEESGSYGKLKSGAGWVKLP